MTDFNQSRIFNGTCAPFMYIADCTPTARTAYMNASRFWLAANSLALIALLTSLIRRSIRVKERLNTLRLTVICFTLGSPLHIIYDALRVSDYKQHGVPIHIMSFLWVVGWVPYIMGMLLLIVTWISFSSKDLMARPALTGYPLLFWGLGIPFIVSSIISSIVCGVNYWWYWVSMRVAVAAWSAFFLIIALFASYYGRKTLQRLKKANDSFNFRQQIRVLIAVIGMFVVCGICLGIQSYFLSRIDEIYQVFLLVTSVYRVSGFIVSIGSAAYVWVSTSHYVSHSTRGASYSERSARRSHAKRNSESRSNDSTEGVSSDEKPGSQQGRRIPRAPLNDISSESVSSSKDSDDHDSTEEDSEIPERESEDDVEEDVENSSSASLLEPYANDSTESASQVSDESISTSES